MVNIQSLMQTVNQMRNNPQQLFQKFKIPQNLKTPEEVAQYLMSSGMVSQAQVNQANNMYKQFFNK